MPHNLRPINYEQREAEEDSIEKELDEIKKTLCREQRNKLKAVEEALEILTKAKVACYIYPQVHLKEENPPESVCQFNNIRQIFGPEPGQLEPTREKKVRMARFNILFHYLVLDQFFDLAENETDIIDTFDHWEQAGLLIHRGDDSFS